MFVLTRNGTSKFRIFAKQDAFFVTACIVCATYCLKTRLSRNNKKTIASLGPIRPNHKSRSSQKDRTSNRWDRSPGMTNQDNLIGPTGSFGLIISIGPTRSFGPIRSIGPTRSFRPIRSLVPARSLGPLSNGYILQSHLQDRTVI